MMVAGNIPGLTQTAAVAIYDAVQAGDSARASWLTMSISLVSLTALWLVQGTLPARGLAR
jgi:molybdate transport system permease protein